MAKASKAKKATNTLAKMIHLERMADDNLNRAICGQCGRPYRSLPCGPTHATIKAERTRKR